VGYAADEAQGFLQAALEGWSFLDSGLVRFRVRVVKMPPPWETCMGAGRMMDLGEDDFAFRDDAIDVEDFAGDEFL